MAESQSVGGQPIGSDVPDVTQLLEFSDKVRGKLITMSATIRCLEKQLKVATERKFEFYSDEPHYLGGEDNHLWGVKTASDPKQAVRARPRA
jgi:hypothetical protein